MRHLKISAPRRTPCEPTVALFRSSNVRHQSGSLVCNAEGFTFSHPLGQMVGREIIVWRQYMAAGDVETRGAANRPPPQTVAALAAKDPLEERSLRFHEDFEFTSVEEDSTAILRTAAVHQHDTRILFLF